MGMDNTRVIRYLRPMTTPIRLAGLDPRTWEHPFDRAALSLLLEVPGLTEGLKLLGNGVSDRSLRLHWLSHAVRSTPTQVSRVWDVVAQACHILDVSPVPEVFVGPGADLNARVFGFHTPFLVIGAGLVDALSPEELLSVVGHEIGHLKAGHAMFRTAVWILTQGALPALQGGELLRLPVYAALLDWERKSELSADRAGLLTCQDPAVALGALVKVCYRGMAGQIDPQELLRQADEWESSGDWVDSVFKVLGSWGERHPALVQRYSALHRWSLGEEYRGILEGTHRDPGPRDPGTDVRRAWDDWKDDLERSSDPGTQVVAEAVRELESLLKGWGRS